MSILLDNFCCNQEITIHRIERCVGGDVLTDSWAVLGLFERTSGFNQQNTNENNASDAVAYFRGDEPFWSTIDFNAAGYYIEFVLPNSKSEFYRVSNFIEGYDFECCNIDHYEAELERVKRPIQCQ